VRMSVPVRVAGTAFILTLAIMFVLIPVRVAGTVFILTLAIMFVLLCARWAGTFFFAFHSVLFLLAVLAEMYYSHVEYESHVLIRNRIDHFLFASCTFDKIRTLENGEVMADGGLLHIYRLAYMADAQVSLKKSEQYFQASLVRKDLEKVRDLPCVGCYTVFIR